MWQPQNFPKWIIIPIALVLTLAVGSAVHQAGWSQGFTMGLLVSSADNSQVASYLLARGGPGMFAGGIGGFFGVLFRIGVIFLLFAIAAKFLGFRRWHMHERHGDRQNGWGNGERQPQTQGAPDASRRSHTGEQATPPHTPETIV